MNKLNIFLNTVTGITNKDRLKIMAYTSALTGMGIYLNNKLFKKEVECMQQESEINSLKLENTALRIELDVLRRANYTNK